MAETLYTKDGKCHVLLDSTTPVSIIRDYCGDEVADWVERNLDYMDRKEQSDLGAYEADLDHLHRMMQDWVEALRIIASKCESTKVTKAAIQREIINLKADIADEL